jgi:SlyX protein
MIRATAGRRAIGMDSSEAEKRLIDIETKHSFQEAAILDMSKVIVEQASRIESLEAVVRGLREKIKELSGEGQLPLPTNETPPHY